MERASVLLVEDNHDHALLTKIALRSLDEVHEVRIAEDGEEALAILRSSAAPDLVLLDLRLPRLDGFALLERIRSDPTLQTLRVVVLSTSEVDADRERAAGLGAVEYLVKPLSVDRLRPLVQSVVRRPALATR